MTERNPYPVLGIDIGATSIKYGMLHAEGKLTDRGSAPIRSASNSDLIAQLAGIIALSEFAPCKSVGIGSPGPLDIEEGVILQSANMPGVKNCAVVKELAQQFPDRSIRLENDANAATLGEFFFGHGRGVTDLAVFTLGTGVGGGCIYGGRLQRGLNGNFFEIGHMPIGAFGETNQQARRCGCGALGCLETYASATGISETYRLETGESLTAAEIAVRAHGSDRAAIRAYDLASVALGLAAATVSQIMNITRFVFTGGVAASEDLLREKLIQVWRQHALPVFHASGSFTFTHGDENAGILGAAALFLEGP